METPNLATLNPDDVVIESFEDVHGRGAVQVTITGALEMRMTPLQALRLGCRICVASVAVESFKVVGKSVSGPHDGEVMAGLIGGALEALLGQQIARHLGGDEQKPDSP